MKSFLIVPFLFAAACGDNNKTTTADATPADSKTVDATPAAAKAVVVGAVFNTSPGIISELDTGTLEVRESIASSVVDGDPQLRKLGTKLYVIERGAGIINVLDAATYTNLGKLSTGATSNPQDVAVVGDTLYVPVAGGTGVVYGTIGGAATTIDLATVVGDADGHPDCVSATAVGTDVYVGCEKLTNFSPTGNGVLVVIDTTTNTVRTHLDLPAQNPQPFSKLMGTNIVMTTYNGCTISIVPGATPTASCLASGTELEGGPIAFDVDGTKLWFVYNSLDFMHGYLRSYDTTTSTYAAKVNGDTEKLQDVAVCPGGKLVVTDGGTTPGLRVYSGTTEVTTAALPFGRPPVFGNSVVCF